MLCWKNSRCQPLNLRFLRSVVAISQYGSLNAAAAQLGLSHSAVSLQIKALEDELQFQILDRSKRPPILTSEGLALVEHAQRMEDVASDIQALAQRDRLFGRVTIGAAPSTIQHLMAPALARLHGAHPDLQIEMVSALSQDLINMALDGEIHAALVTDPGNLNANLETEHVYSEPYRLLVCASEPRRDPDDLLRSRPYIWFDRKTRLSQDVSAYLISRGVEAQSLMEVDSFEGVEALVRHNLGVSILPKRALAPDPDGVRFLRLGDQNHHRRIVIATRKNSPRKLLFKLLQDIFSDLIGQKQD